MLVTRNFTLISVIIASEPRTFPTNFTIVTTIQIYKKATDTSTLT